MKQKSPRLINGPCKYYTINYYTLPARTIIRNYRQYHNEPNMKRRAGRQQCTIDLLISQLSPLNVLETVGVIFFSPAEVKQINNAKCGMVKHSEAVGYVDFSNSG